jgi:hypothetical protein
LIGPEVSVNLALGAVDVSTVSGAGVAVHNCIGAGRTDSLVDVVGLSAGNASYRSTGVDLGSTGQTVRDGCGTGHA